MTATGNRFQAMAKREPASALAVISERDEMKYTIKLSSALRAAIDEDVERLRRDTTKKVGRSDVLRELIRVLHADESLYAEVKRRIQNS
jgi:hypothetical protein